MNALIRPKTVKMISQLLKPLVEEGIVSVPEQNEMIANLKNLSEKGELLPQVTPKLIDQKEAAEMLGVSLANFKKQEREGAFRFKRRMVGSSVRYRNTDVIRFIMSEEAEDKYSDAVE